MPRFQNKTYAGPEEFTGFGESGGTLFKVTKNAAPELYALATQFPAAFSSALKTVGFFVRGEMKSALRKGGPKGVEWPELSRMHVYRRMDLLKAGKVNKVTGEWAHGRRFRLKSKLGHQRITGKERMMERWQGRGILRRSSAMGGRLVNAVRYKMMTPGRGDIGALNASTAQFLAAVQGGRRGSRGVFQFTGSQPVTPAMRRAMWAAGIPLSKDKKTIEQPERPLVAPVFNAVTPEIERLMIGKITETLARKGIDLVF